MARKRNTYNLMDFYRSITQKHPLRYGHQFTVEFFDNQFIDNDITYYIQASKIPQVDIKSVKVPFLAAGFEVPGIISYPESWDVTILLDEDLTQYRLLQEWQEYISSYRLSQGGDKVIPTCYAAINLLDNTMQNVVKRYICRGIWIKELGDVQFEYSEGSSTTQTCKATFALQYWHEDSERDPLAMN